MAGKEYALKYNEVKTNFQGTYHFVAEKNIAKFFEVQHIEEYF